MGIEADKVVKDCDAKKVVEDNAEAELASAKEEREECTEKLVTAREEVTRLEEEEETRIVVSYSTEKEKNAKAELDICEEEIEKRVPEIDDSNAVLEQVKGLLTDLKNK